MIECEFCKQTDVVNIRQQYSFSLVFLKRREKKNQYGLKKAEATKRAR